MPGTSESPEPLSSADHATCLAALCDPARRTPERAAALHDLALARSPTIRDPMFGTLAPEDLRWLFGAYDDLVLDGLLESLVAKHRAQVSFRISQRLTRSGGRATRQRVAGRPFFEIAVSSPLLGWSFTDAARPVRVGGLLCPDRLAALQRIFEHELVHVLEFLLYDASRCSAPRFEALVRGLFGHEDPRHELVTPQEAAMTRLGIAPGRRVAFDFEGRRLDGTVNRITRRATILVPDPAGRLFDDGRRYAVYYVPLSRLEAASDGPPPPGPRG